ncbi:MAG: hypothetical protein K0S74_1894 [Chlamydiales bacterium]|jgi:hypothetical protein|nr:hypothetical protein [Chlamydiales bacterium]
MTKVKEIMDSNYKELVQIEMKAADLSNVIDILQAACEQISETLINSKVGCSIIELRSVKDCLSNYYLEEQEDNAVGPESIHFPVLEINWFNLINRCSSLLNYSFFLDKNNFEGKTIELQVREIMILKRMVTEIYFQIIEPTFWKDLNYERKQFGKFINGISFYYRKMIHDLEIAETCNYRLTIMKKYENLFFNALSKGMQFIIEYDEGTSELETLVDCDYSEIQALQEKINLYFRGNN